MSAKFLSSVISVNSPKPGDDFVTETLTAIDSVHSITSLSCPENVEIVWRNGDGEVAPYGEYQPGGTIIFLDSGYEGRSFTLVHEIGHFIDWNAGDGRSFSSGIEDEYQEWIEAVQDSKWCNRMRRLLRDLTPNDVSRVVGHCLPTYELWARSYQQFVAYRSAHPLLTKPLDAILAVNPEEYEVWYWDRDDFEPIGKCVEEIFQQRGWLE